MQKSIVLLSSLFAIVAMNLVLSSCKDDEPFVKPKLSLSESAMTVSEAVGTIEVEFTLDKAFSQDITVDYDLGGTAVEGSTATSDYSVSGTFGKVQIAAGQTTGVLEIEINSDASFEGNETIEVSIDDVSSTDIDITNDDEIVITITDDDVRAKINFAVATLAANETDRNIQVQVVLDKAVASDISVAFTLTGDAVDSVRSEADEIPADYQIKGETGETATLLIPSGQTTGVIAIKSYSDFYLEDDETFTITLASAGSQVEIGTTSSIEITLAQEDGKAIALFWDDAYSTVDMDLFLWLGDLGDPVADFGLASLSAFADFDGPEIVFVPDIFDNASFGTSYTYYEGDEDPMEFEVQFVDFVDGVAEPLANRDVFPATYTLANINEWDNSDVVPIIVQTFDVTDGVFSTPSAITIPSSGSRVGIPVLAPEVSKQTSNRFSSNRMNKLIKQLKK